MEEVGKIGEIQSVNDFFDFKLSIKTIMIIAFLWGTGCMIFVIVMFGGISNTMDYLTSLMDSLKTTIVKNKVKNNEKPVENEIDKKSND